MKLKHNNRYEPKSRKSKVGTYLRIQYFTIFIAIIININIILFTNIKTQ